MKKTIIALLLCGFLAGCSGTQVVADPVPLKTAPVTIPVIDPIKTSPVNWQVLKSSDMLKLAKSNPNAVIFGLDQTNFQNLSVDLSEATRYMQQEKAVNNMLTDIITSRQAAQSAPTDQTKK